MGFVTQDFFLDGIIGVSVLQSTITLPFCSFFYIYLYLNRVEWRGICRNGFIRDFSLDTVEPVREALEAHERD